MKINSPIDEVSTTGGGGGVAFFTPGTGMQYATPLAFSKEKKPKPLKYMYKLGYKLVKKLNKSPGSTLGQGPPASNKGVKQNAYVKQFGYKLVPNKIKKSGLETKKLFEAEFPEEFQNQRIEAFEIIRKKLNDIYKLLDSGKKYTIDYYQTNPTSYAVVTPTDLILDYLNDIETLLKENKNETTYTSRPV
jgi:hypothetical protein